MKSWRRVEKLTGSDLEIFIKMVSVERSNQVGLVPRILDQHGNEILEGSFTALSREVKLVISANSQ